MRNYDFIKNKMIEKHEIIESHEYLDKYIDFLVNYSQLNPSNEDYTENHHILPKCTFPEFKNENWNIINLSYKDHIMVHLWLFKSINIRNYQRPLNWMLKCYKNTEEISNAAKKGWVKLKLDKVKFDEFKKKRSTYMGLLSSDEQRRRAFLFWENISDEKYIDFCSSMKKLWTEERRSKKSKSMIEYYNIDENRNKKSIEVTNRWKSISDDDRLKFNETMSDVNKDIVKRKIAGEKIKKLWMTDEYLSKMKKRRSREGVGIKIIKDDGIEIIFNTMIDFTTQYNFSAHLIRKYRDKNIKISKKDLNESNITLLDCIIETIEK